MAGTSPTVSIVLPTHDGSRFLGQAVQSCLGQTFRDLELIVVDDASTDCTATLLHEHALSDKRLTVLRNQDNRGLPASLNRGFSAASGRYLTWTSDDNWYRPGALQAMLSFLDGHPTVDLVYADHTVVHEHPFLEEARTCEPAENLTEVNVVQACFLFRRSLLEKLGDHDESLACAEDYDYWLRAQVEGFLLAPLHQDLYVYRLHGSSLTERQPRKVLRATFLTLQHHLTRLPLASPLQRARGHQRLAELARELGDLPAFRRHLLRSLLASPAVPFRRRRSRRSPLLNFFTFAFGFQATERLRKLRHRHEVH